MATAHDVAAELAAINRRIRSLQERRSRPKRKFAVVSTNDPPDDGSGFSDDLDGVAEGLRLTVPPCAHRVLAVFILLNQDGLAAAHFLAAQNKLRVADSLLQSLRRLVEDAYLALSIEAIVDVLSPPTSARQYSELFLAGRFVVAYRLHAWVLEQNKKGVAPSRRQMVFAARSLAPSELPSVVTNKLDQYWQGHGSPRLQRKWLQRFRRTYGLRFGRVPMQAVMPVEEMQRKAGHPECDLMPFPLAPFAMIFLKKTHIASGFRIMSLF